jgi:hypothetical protein
MNTLVKILSTSIDNLNRRVVKYLKYGLGDVQTSIEAGPFGIDSNPLKDMVAIYGTTDDKGKTVIIGYINKFQLAKVKPGETRLYAIREDKTPGLELYLKDDGTAEFGGNADNLVRYSKLEEGFNQLKSDLNDFITKYNTFAAAYTPGSPSSVGTPPTIEQATESEASIEDAKITQIKTS